MSFGSILYPDLKRAPAAEVAETPEIFRDLNLDQIVAAITIGKAEYRLEPFFYAPLTDADTVRYRQAVMHDLDDAGLTAAVLRFAATMHQMREDRARSTKLYYDRQKHWWLLEAAVVYCRAVQEFGERLAALEPRSSGMQGIRAYIAEYCTSPTFQELSTEARRVEEELARITYSLIIKDDSVTVRDYASEIDYSVDVEQTFQKFAQNAGKDYRVTFREQFEMNHVEAAIADFVARLNPKEFTDLAQFAERYADYDDPTITRFDREIQFYLSYRDYIAPLIRAKLSFCMPDFSTAAEGVFATDAFALALAHKLVGTAASVVCNDFTLRDAERAIIVSGPNQGGKTTFLRMFGQLHYLASLGLPVPGTRARLLLPDRIFTHFEREEKVENLRSKFEDDLLRMRRIIAAATERSIVLMNESFSSTSLEDAVFVGRKVVEGILAKDALCVYVTFVDELSRLSASTVSMVSTIVPGDPASRTFKVVRREADGRAYAMAIAAKHGLTYDTLCQRLG